MQEKDFSKNSLDMENEQAILVRKMLGHYDTEPKFLAMMVPEFVQYQLSKNKIDDKMVSSLEDEFNKDTELTLFFKDLFCLIKKYFMKFVSS